MSSNYKRERTAYLNCEKRIFDIDNKYGFPHIESCNVDLENAQLIGFNFALNEKHPDDKIVHFYLDDYQFIRVWNNPDRYVPILQKFKAVLTPDFSMYIDFPKALQIYTRYRTQWLGAYWQEAGIKVIPTINWSDEESFEWCFDGLPRHSLVSISNIGGFSTKEVKDHWILGYKKALEVLQPTEILMWGTKRAEIEEIKFNGKITFFNNKFYKKFDQMRKIKNEW